MALTITPPSLCIFSVSLTLPPPATISYPPIFFLLFPSFCLSLSCLPPPPPFPMSASLLLLCFLSPPSLLLFQSFQLPPPPPFCPSLPLSLTSLSLFLLSLVSCTWCLDPLVMHCCILMLPCFTAATRCCWGCFSPWPSAAQCLWWTPYAATRCPTCRPCSTPREMQSK